MRRLGLAMVVCVGALLAGCSTLPQPVNSPAQDSTLSIIAKARCEMKLAMISELGAFLADPYPPSGKPVDRELIERGRMYRERTRAGHAVTAQELRDLEASLLKLSYENLESLSPAQLATLDRIAGTAVGYGFKLSAQEMNDNRLDLSFVVPFSDESLSIGLVGGTKLDRKDERTIDMTDSFHLLRRLNCARLLETANSSLAAASESARSLRGGLLYPMSGTIGLDHVMASYVGAVVRTDPRLDPRDADQRCEVDGNEAPAELCRLSVTGFIDKVTFATTFSGEVNPTLSFTAADNRRGFQFKEGKVSAKPNRIDTHELTITLKPGKKPAKKSGPAKPTIPDGESYEKFAVESDGNAYTMVWSKAKGASPKPARVTLIAGEGPGEERFDFRIGEGAASEPAFAIGAAPSARARADSQELKDGRMFMRPTLDTLREIELQLRERGRLKDLADDIQELL